MNPSLAQWVASQGGISIDAKRTGEIARIRELNRTLRGSRRVVSPTAGIPYDRMAMYAAEAGFRVADADEFLDALEQDAAALARKDSRKRVIVDYELDDVDFAYPDDDTTRADAEHHHDHTCCGVCGRPSEDGLCPDCADWAAGIFRDYFIRKSRERTCLAFFESMRGQL